MLTQVTKILIICTIVLVSSCAQLPVNFEAKPSDELKHYRVVEKLSDANGNKKSTVCIEPRPQICTMQYMPVCATLGDGSTKTYATDCSACSDAKVVSYSADACK